MPTEYEEHMHPCWDHQHVAGWWWYKFQVYYMTKSHGSYLCLEYIYSTYIFCIYSVYILYIFCIYSIYILHIFYTYFGVEGNGWHIACNIPRTLLSCCLIGECQWYLFILLLMVWTFFLSVPGLIVWRMKLWTWHLGLVVFKHSIWNSTE